MYLYIYAYGLQLKFTVIAIWYVPRNKWNLWQDSFMCATWLLHVCAMTHSCVWHDAFTRGTWLIRVCDMTHSNVRSDLFMYAKWLMHICKMTHSHVRKDSFKYAKLIIHICEVTYSYTWSDSFMCTTHTHSRMCDMTHSCVCLKMRVSPLLTEAVRIAVCCRVLQCVAVRGGKRGNTFSSLCVESGCHISSGSPVRHSPLRMSAVCVCVCVCVCACVLLRKRERERERVLW